jgi:UDP-N-acetylglucosamine 2-epimerase (non-hydrolysing)
MGNPKVSIVIVVGTRPEAIKLVPLILALRESEIFRPLVVSTGQHHRMVEEVLDLAGIQPDYNLWVGGARSQLNDRVREVIGRLDDFCREEFGADGTIRQDGSIRDGRYPVAILVHGDTTSAMSASLASFHLRIPIVHVEAGLRSGNNLTPYPEEMNRLLITCMSCFHLAPTTRNMQNLIREDIPADQVLVTGNTGIDALQWAAGLQTDISDPQLRELYHSDRRLVVITAHRRENWDIGIDGIALGVHRLASENPDVSFVVPQHPNPLVRQKWAALSEAENVHLTEPAPYAEFAKLLARCYFVITDSGGIQEEAPSLGKPVLVARESTERTEGVEAGTLILTGTDPDLIYEQSMRLINDEVAYQRISGAKNPYGDGRASERIVAALENLYHGGPKPEPFGSGYSRRAVVEAAGFSMPDPSQPELDPELLPSSLRGLLPHRDADEVWPDSSQIAESEPAT